MISHALTIVANEMGRHFQEAYPTAAGSTNTAIAPGNISEGFGSTNSGAVSRDALVLTIVNIGEEKALRNLPNAVRNDTTLRVTYENPPIYLNLTVLLTATHKDYTTALKMLSRALRFLQSTNVFTHSSVAPASVMTNAPANTLDQLAEFKLTFDLYSPTLEELNHLWGTLGGKQYPSVLFNLRLLDLQFRAVQAEGGLITEVVRDFSHKSGVS